jgi:Kef-type K+ transport system membrane component KefB
MSAVSSDGLLIISVIAVAAPILAAAVKRGVNLPSPVVEIVAGIVVGPSVLGWVKIDQPINAVALLRLSFLLFLAGLEVNLRATTGRQLLAPLAGFAVSLGLGTVAGVAFHAVGLVRSPFFLAITLAATSLGLVVPVLADAGLTDTVLGQLIISGATAGEFGAIALLTFFVSGAKGGARRRALVGPGVPSRRPHPGPW